MENGSLDQLSRKELQSIAKDNGIKANLSSKEIKRLLREYPSPSDPATPQPTTEAVVRQQLLELQLSCGDFVVAQLAAGVDKLKVRTDERVRTYIEDAHIMLMELDRVSEEFSRLRAATDFTRNAAQYSYAELFACLERVRGEIQYEDAEIQSRGNAIQASLLVINPIAKDEVSTSVSTTTAKPTSNLTWDELQRSRAVRTKVVLHYETALDDFLATRGVPPDAVRHLAEDYAKLRTALILTNREVLLSEVAHIQPVVREFLSHVLDVLGSDMEILTGGAEILPITLGGQSYKGKADVRVLMAGGAVGAWQLRMRVLVEVKNLLKFYLHSIFNTRAQNVANVMGAAELRDNVLVGAEGDDAVLDQDPGLSTTAATRTLGSILCDMIAVSIGIHTRSDDGAHSYAYTPRTFSALTGVKLMIFSLISTDIERATFLRGCQQAEPGPQGDNGEPDRADPAEGESCQYPHNPHDANGGGSGGGGGRGGGGRGGGCDGGDHGGGGRGGGGRGGGDGGDTRRHGSGDLSGGKSGEPVSQESSRGDGGGAGSSQASSNKGHIGQKCGVTACAQQCNKENFPRAGYRPVTPYNLAVHNGYEPYLEC